MFNNNTKSQPPEEPGLAIQWPFGTRKPRENSMMMKVGKLMLFPIVLGTAPKDYLTPENSIEDQPMPEIVSTNQVPTCNSNSTRSGQSTGV